MLTLPPGFQDAISTFSPAFRKDVWPKVLTLLTGAIICPGSRTVCNLLRSVGLQAERCFPKYHRVLSTDRWSAKNLAGVLLSLLVSAFVAKGEALVFAIDDTIERRWGKKISKRGIYRDPVRSSKSHFVKCSGLRWLSLSLLTGLPWLEAGVYWALPVLTALCPSERYYKNKGKHPKKLTDWARQMVTWLARHTTALGRAVYLIGDGSFASYELFMHTQYVAVTMIARMKFNAQLYELPPKERPKGKRGPMPKTGQRLPSMEQRLTDDQTKWKRATFSDWYGKQNKEMLFTSGVAVWHKSNKLTVHIKWVLLKDPEGKLEPALLACTDTELSDEKIISLFVRRWRIEVTFAEVRRHLGVESQRQWSDLAIERSTPSLMALFSVVCLMTNTLHKQCPIKPNSTAWYKKEGVTFADVHAAVRMEIFSKAKLSTSHLMPDVESFSHRIRHLWFLLTQAAA